MASFHGSPQKMLIKTIFDFGNSFRFETQEPFDFLIGHTASVVCTEATLDFCMSHD